MKIRVKEYSIGAIVDALATYIRENGYPRFKDYRFKVEFRPDDIWEGWMISEITDKGLVRVFDAGMASGNPVYEVSENGVPFRKNVNEALFKVDKHYYYFNK